MVPLKRVSAACALAVLVCWTASGAVRYHSKQVHRVHLNTTNIQTSDQLDGRSLPPAFASSPDNAAVGPDAKNTTGADGKAQGQQKYR